LLVVGFTSGRIPEMRANYALLKNIAILGSPLEHYLESSGAAVMQALEKILVEIPAADLVLWPPEVLQSFVRESDCI